MQDLNLRLLPCKGSTLATELIAPTGGEGFEPPEPFTRFSGFQDHRDQPLCHPPNTSDRIRTCNNMDLNHAPLPIGSRTQKRNGKVLHERIRGLSEFLYQAIAISSSSTLSNVGSTRTTRFIPYRVLPVLVSDVTIRQLPYCSTCDLMSLMVARKLPQLKREDASAEVRVLPFERKSMIRRLLLMLLIMRNSCVPMFS